MQLIIVCATLLKAMNTLTTVCKHAWDSTTAVVLWEWIGYIKGDYQLCTLQTQQIVVY